MKTSPFRPGAPPRGPRLPGDAPVLRLADFVSLRGGSKPGDLARGVAYAEDVWVLQDLLASDPTLTTSDATLRFDTLPAWLRDDAKHWLATLWLEEGKSPERLRQVRNTLSYLASALPDYTGTPAGLGVHDARSVERRLADDYRASRIAAGTAMQRQGLLNQFARHLRTRHAPHGPARFAIRLPKDIRVAAQGKAFGTDLDKILSADVRARILDACAEDELAYAAALRRHRDGEPQPLGYSLDDYLGRAIKAQAVKLFITTGRRAKEVCSLPTDPRCDRSSDPEAPGVDVYFRETKISNADRPAFAPSYYGQLALDAIQKAQQYGAALRDAAPRHADFLFVIPGSRQRGEPVTLLKPALINQYLRYDRPGRGGRPAQDTGLLARHDVRIDGDVAAITSHNFRHTRGTLVYGGSGHVQVVSQDLNHVTPDMAIKHYVGLDPEVRALHRREVEAGALSGSIFEALGGPANQQIVDESITPELATRRSRRLIVLQPTAFGFCSYGAESGPCTVSSKCYIGDDPDGAASGEGRGCKHQVLAPHARPALEEDARVIAAHVATYSADPAHRRLAEHFALQLRIVEAQLDRIARELEPRLAASPSDPTDA